MMKSECLALWQERLLEEKYLNAKNGYIGKSEGAFEHDMPVYRYSDIKDIPGEANQIINFLMSEDAENMLCGLKQMDVYCHNHMEGHIPYSFHMECWCFRILTESHVWYLFCLPWNERCPFYFQIFDKEKLFTFLATENDLPYTCCSIYPFTGERIRLYFGSNDVLKFPQYGIDIKENEAWVKTENESISIMQRKAMENGAIFGWMTPMANPKNYDKNGVFRIQNE